MNAIKRHILPYPLLSLSLVVMWLLLQQTVSLGHLLLGSIIAIGAGKAMQALQPDQPKIRNPIAIIKLIGYVVADVLRSNIAVAIISVSGRKHQPHPAFILMPLELTDKLGLAVLSIIVTATPGSAWLEYTPAHKTVLLHVLDVIDEDEWVRTVKHRYERLLMEIFQ
jgi:multicomponent K+:H+ antiporter subunit E